MVILTPNISLEMAENRIRADQDGGEEGTENNASEDENLLDAKTIFKYNKFPVNPKNKINKQKKTERSKWSLDPFVFLLISNLVKINSKIQPRITTKEIDRASEISLKSFLKIKEIKIIIIGIDKINLLTSISSANFKFLSAIIIDLRFPENIWQINIVRLVINPISALRAKYPDIKKVNKIKFAKKLLINKLGYIENILK